MGKQANVQVQNARQEHTQKLKKNCKKSKDIRKQPHLKREQLRKMVCSTYSKNVLTKGLIQRFYRAQAFITKQMIRSESLTCPICFEIIVGSALTQCGHMFCLNCIETVQCSSLHCPLCRSQMQNDRFVCSQIFDKIILKYVKEILSQEESQNYQKRLNQFLSIQSRREIRCKLYVGDTLDYRVNLSWIAVRITKIEGDYIYICQLDKNTGLDLSEPVHKFSRKLARFRTFTKLPPLRPTYYSQKMNFSNQSFSFIVEPPIHRSQFRNSTEHNSMPQSLTISQFSPSRWEQLQVVSRRDEWMFSDQQIPYGINQDIWSIFNQRDDFILFT